MSWTNIKDLADSSLEKKGIKEKASQALLLSQANELLAEIFGADSLEKVRAVYWQDGELSIAVLSDDLYHSLLEQKDFFISRLNDRQAYKTVSTLRFLN